MKIQTLIWSISFVLFIFFQNYALAQVNELPFQEDHSYKPLKLNLSEDGKKYVRFVMWHQLWLNSNDLSAQNNKLQIKPSIRRSRFLVFSQISSRFLILTHFGVNGLSTANLTSLGNNDNAPQLFLHGAWGEVKINNALFMGIGLHYWKGLTRLSNASTLNFMTLDQSRPFAHWHSLGITDQFARHLGVYAKGELGKFDYCVAFNSPEQNPLNDGLNYNLADTSLSYTGVSTIDRMGNPTGNFLTEAYVRYNFWEKEATKLPYQVGTYLGRKKVLGIGAGFFLHPNGIYNKTKGEHENVTHFAIDVFMEYPNPNGGTLHAYASFIRFDYGENYISRWAGTGTNIYGQLGCFFKSVKIMPYVAYQRGVYKGFEKPIYSLDVGANYYINDHNCKLTLEYHQIAGDIREKAINTITDTFSQIRFQFHVFL